VYFVRVALMGWMVKTYVNYYPEKDMPTYLGKSYLKFLCQYGGNIAAAASSILLLVTLVCLVNRNSHLQIQQLLTS